jgi:hypothetical protein
LKAINEIEDCQKNWLQHIYRMMSVLKHWDKGILDIQGKLEGLGTGSYA